MKEKGLRQEQHDVLLVDKIYYLFICLKSMRRKMEVGISEFMEISYKLLTDIILAHYRTNSH